MRRRGASGEQISRRADRCYAAEREIASGDVDKAVALPTKSVNEKLPDKKELDIIRARMRR